MSVLPRLLLGGDDAGGLASTDMSAIDAEVDGATNKRVCHSGDTVTTRSSPLDARCTVGALVAVHGCSLSDDEANTYHGGADYYGVVSCGVEAHPSVLCMTSCSADTHSTLQRTNATIDTVLSTVGCCPFDHNLQ